MSLEAGSSNNRDTGDDAPAHGTGELVFAYEELDRCQSLIENLLDEREATKATVADLTAKFDALRLEKEELLRTLSGKEEELAELKQGGQLVRDKAAKILLRLQESIAH